ncbi:MAG: gliding motility-associated C-terminal domain-containing protein, partial [bacterium]
TDINGCTEIISDTVNIHVKETPFISLTSSSANDTVCYNESVSFTADPAGYAEYSFYLNNEQMQTGASNKLSLSGLSDNDRVYAMANDNGCWSAKSNSITTTVNDGLPPPQVNCGETNSGMIEYTWDPVPGAIAYEISIDNGSFTDPSSGSTGLSHTITGLTENASHSIEVRALDGVCGEGLVSEVVNCEAINCPPITFTTNALYREVCEDEWVDLSVDNVSIPDYAIEWNNDPAENGSDYGIYAQTDISVPVKVSNSTEPVCPSVEKNFIIGVTPKQDIDLISSNGSEPVCEDEEVILSVSPLNLDYFEFYDNGLMVASGEDYEYRVKEPRNGHQFYARVRDNACTLYSDTVYLNVNSQLKTPVVNYEFSTENSVSFRWAAVPGATAYIVSVNEGAYGYPSSGLEGLTHTVSPLAPGEAVTVTVIALGEGACGNSAVSQPAIAYAESCEPIEFSIEEEFRICSGDSVKLEIKDLSIYNYEISWSGSPWGREKTVWVKPEEDTLISVRVRNNDQPLCPGTIKYVEIEVIRRPVTLTLTSSDTDNLICEGERVTYTASPGGYDRYIFYNNSWKTSEGPYNTFSIEGKSDESHRIFARAMNEGCAGEMSNVVGTEVIPPLKTPQVNCGSSTENYISFVWDSIPGAMEYTVSVNGQAFELPSTGSTGLMHELNGFSAGDSANISVIAIGEYPCSNSFPSVSTTCYANNCEAIDFTIDPYRDLCEGEEISLSMSNISVSNYSVSWGGEAYGSETLLDMEAVSDTLIQVKLRDEDQDICPPASKQFEIKVREIVEVTMSTNATGDSVCAGNELELTVMPTGFEQYIFYNKSDALQDSAWNKYSSSQFPDDNELYAVVYQNGCYSRTNSVNAAILHPEPLRLNASKSGKVCRNEEIDLTATTGFASYTYSNGSSEILSGSEDVIQLAINDTLITAVAIDENNCISESLDTIRFNILPLPEVTLSCSVDTICYGEYANYSVNPSDLNEYSFFNNNLMVQQSESSFYSTDSLERGERISIVATDANGCESQKISSDFPFILPYPETSIMQENKGLCMGDTMMLYMLKDPVYTVSDYYWSNGERTDTLYVSPTATTNYSLFYSDGICNNIKLDSKTVEVDRETPPVAYAGEDVVICINDSIQLQAEGGLNFEWNNPLTLDDPMISNPFAFPLDTTDYVVTVRNTYCTDTDTVLVIVDLCLEDLPDPVPQIITPNGDGINDYWEITHVDYFENNKLEIFNRWGNKVFTAKPYHNHWNGISDRGVDLPEGTYYYILELGNGLSHTGYIIIHR